ncbi:tRNA (N6-threonylcarbamoyladenosine(37)-N6)-methyltransferase TrmO [Bdellovibrio svalbardensis]|uniref:tRNA (N6-threonylcarbamoyladenosine(37)-N6)-methyltransferase TrmO n=1 Tax=Bdellovibrio svalbardensis TaxID=2972972 RepID=A0ABT6DQA0_9BACT|nr:tRNA (N6-threonylcarbamoyladenosine(37)-N6)-methyltransferase TrmO [Bdellovibrio svalbardensis]MDG0817323.1 tRNA (N6-threonylcarbamoyladenosine(37)-N6)-methyltransferase TrmO [Bdellovibrio svalbardensis]
MASEKIEFTPIGYFRSSQVHPYEAGRQPDAHHAEGVIELSSGSNFEQALTGLEGCERIWIIFLFHHNNHWNPMVLPPRGVDSKIGVFATRSPYRPNPVGMSCVKVLKIDKLKITVEGADLLDGSPILDIKPYVAYADSFPGSEPEWLKSAEKFEIGFSELVLQQLEELERQGLTQLRSFLLHQLEYEPANSKKKRVKEEGSGYVIAYRTWRAFFRLNGLSLKVERIYSGYSQDDLQKDEDPYSDKELHRKFILKFT